MKQPAGFDHDKLAKQIAMILYRKLEARLKTINLEDYYHLPPPSPDKQDKVVVLNKSPAKGV